MVTSNVNIICENSNCPYRSNPVGGDGACFCTLEAIKIRPNGGCSIWYKPDSRPRVKPLECISSKNFDNFV